jgi:hypothetical protein
MNNADKKINLNFSTFQAEAAGVSLFNPLVNNSVIMKKSLEQEFGLSIHQGQFMIGFDGNPLTGEIFFMIPDDPQ